MKVRRSTIEAYSDIVVLGARAVLAFSPGGRDSRRALAAQIKAYPDFFLGAYDGAKLVGVVLISCDSRKGWINRMAVDSEFRRRGIAKALVAIR